MRCDTISAKTDTLCQCSYMNLRRLDLASLKQDTDKPAWPASHTNATSKMYENDIRDTISPVAWLTGQPDSFEHALNMT